MAQKATVLLIGYTDGQYIFSAYVPDPDIQVAPSVQIDVEGVMQDFSSEEADITCDLNTVFKWKQKSSKQGVKDFLSATIRKGKFIIFGIVNGCVLDTTGDTHKVAKMNPAPETILDAINTWIAEHAKGTPYRTAVPVYTYPG